MGFSLSLQNKKKNWQTEIYIDVCIYLLSKIKRTMRAIKNNVNNNISFCACTCVCDISKKILQHSIEMMLAHKRTESTKTKTKRSILMELLFCFSCMCECGESVCLWFWIGFFLVNLKHIYIYIMIYRLSKIDNLLFWFIYDFIVHFSRFKFSFFFSIFLII